MKHEKHGQKRNSLKPSRVGGSVGFTKDMVNAMPGVIGDTMRDSGGIVLSDFGR